MQAPEWLRSQEVDETGRERLNWWRVLLLVFGILGTVIFMVYLISGFEREEKEEIREEIKESPKEPKITFDDIEFEEPAKEITTQTAPSNGESKKEEKEKEPDPREEILARLGQERFASFQMDHKRVAEFREIAGSSGIGACDIMPGTVAKIRLDRPTSTDNGGVVTGILAEPVPGHDGCIALDGGEVFTGMVDTNVGFGQNRANLVFTSITDEGRVIEIQSPAGDAMGGGGVPGEVDHHWGSKIAGVAVATGVDLAGFALAGGGSGYGIIVGNAGSVLDDFARQFINRKNTITTDPSQDGQIVTITFTQKVSM